MSYKKIIPVIYLKDEMCYTSKTCSTFIGEENTTAVELALEYQNRGADEVMIIDLSYDDESHEKAINVIRAVTKKIDIPVITGGNVKRVEDVKKYLYAGSKAALLDSERESNVLMLKEVADRFGKDKIGLIVGTADIDAIRVAKDNEISGLYILSENDSFVKTANTVNLPIVMCVSNESVCINVLGQDKVAAVTGPFVSGINFDFINLKEKLSANGIAVNKFESSMSFSEFKLNEEGLIPVIVQDYKTDEVLMLAYMNEEAYNQTIKTAMMTYYSRSRQELWVKGLTSGHFQYVMSLDIDCDRDTILAKVRQVGAACHTGNKSCFYTNLVKKDIMQTNPLKVFNEVMNVILDRKEHPKEGSYTNYLFDKGIDKILKKCGEEATEIVIAAKNPDPEEIKYEISDFLYHVMVLMAVKDVTWDDIVKELANR